MPSPPCPHSVSPVFNDKIIYHNHSLSSVLVPTVQPSLDVVAALNAYRYQLIVSSLKLLVGLAFVVYCNEIVFE